MEKLRKMKTNFYLLQEIYENSFLLRHIKIGKNIKNITRMEIYTLMEKKNQLS